MSLRKFATDMQNRKFVHSEFAEITSGVLMLNMALTGAGFKLPSKVKYTQAKLFIGSVITFVKLHGDSLGISSINIDLPYQTSEFKKAFEQSGFHRALLATSYELRVPDEWFAPQYTRYL